MNFLNVVACAVPPQRSSSFLLSVQAPSGSSYECVLCNRVRVDTAKDKEKTNYINIPVNYTNKWHKKILTGLFNSEPILKA